MFVLVPSKLFAKVLLAFRPFAMCLEVVKLCSLMGEGRLLSFEWHGVFSADL
jgi:hypothetical protein